MSNGNLLLPMIQEFNYSEKECRMIEKDGEIWFLAVDVCKILELSDVSSSMRKLDEDEKDKQSLPTPSGNQNLWIINEPGLYSLIGSSYKPEAKVFKRWINHEILPSIRKTGKYEMSVSTFLDLSEEEKGIAYLQERMRRKKEEKERLMLEQKIEFDKPKIEFYDDVLNEGDEWFSCGEVAKMFVAKDRRKTLGRNGLIEFLKEKNHIFKGRNGYEAYQPQVSQLLYRTNIERGHHGIKTSVIISCKGIVRLSELLKSEGFVLSANSILKKNKRESGLI